MTIGLKRTYAYVVALMLNKSIAVNAPDIDGPHCLTAAVDV